MNHEELLKQAKIKATKFLVSADKKTRELYEISATKIKIMDANNDIDNLYKDLGRAIYDANINDVQNTGDVTDLMVQISSKIYERDALQNASEVRKTTKVCSVCNNIYPKEDGFCSNCED